MLEEERNEVYEATDDTEIEVDAFSHIKKDQYLTKLFCWICTFLIMINRKIRHFKHHQVL